MYKWDERKGFQHRRLLRNENSCAVGVIDWRDGKSCWVFTMCTNSTNAETALFEVGHDPGKYPDTEYLLNLFLLRYEGC